MDPEQSSPPSLPPESLPPESLPSQSLPSQSLPPQPALELKLPSIMNPLMSQPSAPSGETASPQYPSLDAAVAVNQPLAPTLANLLASTSAVVGSATGPAVATTAAASPPPETSGSTPDPLPLAGEGDAAGSGPASAQESNSAQGSEIEIQLDLLEGEGAIAPVPSRPIGQQVRIKREDGHVAIVLPKEQINPNPDAGSVDFIDSELWHELQQRLSGRESFGPNPVPAYLYAQNCLLDTRQLQEMAEALNRFDLKLERIITSRRQTAVAAAMSGYCADQTSQLPDLLGDGGTGPAATPALAEPLYLQKTVRSGAEIRHPGSVIIVGDLNPGSSIIADGDILVWGRLRGVAHAGASGNGRSVIMALKLEPTQLRIADAVARVSATPGGLLSPEVAYVTPNGIRIASSANFSRPSGE